MSLVVLGASYKTLPLEQLERISIPQAVISESLAELAAAEGTSGAIILSTCNRIELYVDAVTDRIGNDACRKLFESRGVTDFSGFYLERGDAVPRHLFRVVCSLDSQVLGETQILGQVKEAFAQATKAGTCTEVLTRLFKDALSIGKRVRSETTIGLNSVSLSTSAFKVAIREFGDIAACRILFIGAGEMASLSLAYLIEAGASDFLVTSRTLEHARSFADNCKGRAIPFEQRYEAMATADIVFSMTSANDIVVEAGKLDRARREAGTNCRKLLIIDQAMPHDVQTECNELSGVTLYAIDTLGRIVDEGIAVRMSAVGEAERMIAEAVRGFLAWMQLRTVVPTIREMYAKGAATVESELAHVVRALESQRGGSCVVRLKGGDPFLFGRGGEEALALSRAGVPFEVVPGVTSGIAALAYAGIPVTHRGIASTVSFVTGHEDPAKGESNIDWQSLASLARCGGTVCLYMGMRNLGLLSERLQANGLPGEFPVAIVQWGTTPRQTLPSLLRDVGASVDVVAAYKTVAPPSGYEMDLVEQLEAGAIDGITFTSSSTARNLVAMLGAKAGILEKATLFSIGPITSATLRDLGFNETIEAREYTINGLLRAITGEER